MNLQGSINTPKTITASTQSPVWLWTLAIAVTNTFLVTGNGFSGDLGYWVSWTLHLQEHGLRDLNANYPPIFIYWLWLVGAFHQLMGIDVAPTLFMRFLVNTPVMLSHIGLLYLVAHGARQTNIQADCDANAKLIGLTALNPAFLINGPIWGQVDLVYCLPTAIALYLLISARALVWVLPLLTIGILTKFQTIFVAPVALPLLWSRRNRELLLGLLPTICIIFGTLLPYLIAGSLWEMISAAYVNSSKTYPLATMNAHNLWFLLDLNNVSYDFALIDPKDGANGWKTMFTPKVMGFLLFAVASLLTIVKCWKVDTVENHWRSLIFSAVAFFMLLPAMHERYLVAAVVVATVATAVTPSLWPHLLMLSVLATLNMQFVLHPVGGEIPWLLSCVSTIYLISLAAPAQLLKQLRSYCVRVTYKWWICAATAVWGFGLFAYSEPLRPSNGWRDATRLPLEHSSQGWGSLRVGRSVDDHQLRVGHQRYESGFGTHAPSTISMLVPKDSTTLVGLVGIDDESGGGEAEFLVLINNKVVWRSGTIRGGDRAKSFSVEVHSDQHVALIVDPLGDSNYDHADWLDLRFKLSDL